MVKLSIMEKFGREARLRFGQRYRISPQDLSTSDEEGSLVNAPHESLSTGFNCANDGNIPCGFMAHGA